MDSASTLKLNGRAVNYIDQGQGAPLLLVHGFPLDHSMWQRQVDFFQSNYRVICPDLPGFGASEPMIEPNNGSGEPVGDTKSTRDSLTTIPKATVSADKSISMESRAEWLADFLESIACVQPVNYCGLSMGGCIGWQFWRRHLDRLKLMIAANTRSAKDDELVRRARHMAAAQVRVSGAQSVADAMVEKLFYVASDQNPLELEYIAGVHKTILTTDPDTISGGQIGMSQRVDATGWLSEIAIPMLFIGGEFDTITPPAEMQVNATAANNAGYETIPAAGHLTPLEQPDAFNLTVNQFLENLT